MSQSIEDILGVPRPGPAKKTTMRFSLLFFSDVRQDINDQEKYRFLTDLTCFADGAGFEAVYFPERHFHEFGSIFANPAIVAAHLIPQTTQLRFRTAGVTIPLHHPAEIVENWAMNDVLSGGRVDLGFGSGWAKSDFIYAPEHFSERRRICSEGIDVIRRLWRGESLGFPGPDGEEVEVTVYPRPIQPELNVWLLVTQNEEAFIHAGRQGYNVFTMLSGTNLETLSRKIELYRAARREVGLDPSTGTITLTLHTLLGADRKNVLDAIDEPFRRYIKSSLDAHVNSGALAQSSPEMSEGERQKVLDYAYQRFVQTGALFGNLDDGRDMVARASAAGVDEIACLMDFGVDYNLVRASLPMLSKLVSEYTNHA